MTHVFEDYNRPPLHVPFRQGEAGQAFGIACSSLPSPNGLKLLVCDVVKGNVNRPKAAEFIVALSQGYNALPAKAEFSTYTRHEVQPFGDGREVRYYYTTDAAGRECFARFALSHIPTPFSEPSLLVGPDGLTPSPFEGVAGRQIPFTD